MASRPRTLTLWTRGLLFIVGVAYLQWGPIRTQALGYSKLDESMIWRMYSGAAADYCMPTFTIETADGTIEPVSRYDVLDYEHWFKAPKSIRRPKNEAAIRSIASSMCRKLPRGTTLNGSIVCARKSGWSPRDPVTCTGRAKE